MREARRRIGVLLGVLAVSVAALLVGTSFAAAKTVVKTVPAEVVALDKFNPTNPLQCGALGFVRWKDPPLKVEAIPVAWTVFYTVKATGEVRSDTATPPFHDSKEHVGAEYLVGGGAHWWIISWGSRVGAGTDKKGCSDMTENILTKFGSPAWVEITFDLKEPTVNKAKCKAARAELRKRNRAVSKLLGKLNRASNGNAKNRIRKQLATAKNKRANAIRKLNKACN